MSFLIYMAVGIALLAPLRYLGRWIARRYRNPNR
jgi:hypothetical protein